MTPLQKQTLINAVLDVIGLAAIVVISYGGFLIIHGVTS